LTVEGMSAGELEDLVAIQAIVAMQD
jgi:hypothetical protein